MTYYEPQVFNTHPLSKKEFFSVMLWCSVYLYYTVLLFRLLENEALKILSIRQRRKNRHKFGRTKVCKAEEVRKYFVNPKIEIEVFS